MRGTFWGGWGRYYPLKHFFPTPTFPPCSIAFPGLVKFRGHAVSRFSANTVPRSAHTSPLDEALSSSFPTGWDQFLYSR